MLSTRTVTSGDGFSIADVACHHRRGAGAPEQGPGGYAIVLVRRGCFVRSADGVETVLDPTLAYCIVPGQEQRYDHPHGGGDDCTSISIDEQLCASLLGGEPELPRGAIRTTPAADLHHRLLLAEVSRSGDEHALFERVLELLAEVLSGADGARILSGRPAGERARRLLAGQAREALAAAPGRSLVDVARELAVSPHHLSRVFRAQTGETLSRHRMRLRARAALERLASGERDLARLAADLGFADQSHLTRVLRDETGRTPASLRAALAA